MNITQITQLLNIAQLAIDLHKARNATVPAKDAYYAVLREFGKGKPTERLDPRNESCAEIIAYSKDAFKTYQAAKRRVYNVQRRLDNACRNAALPGVTPC